MKFKRKIKTEVYKDFPQMGKLCDMAVGDQLTFAKHSCPSRVKLEKAIKKRFNKEGQSFQVFVGTGGVLIRRLT